MVNGRLIKQGYFFKINRKYGSRFWINNPTLKEVRLAIKAGAVGCTTNPTYAMKLLKSSDEAEKNEVKKIIKESLEETSDNNKAAQLIQSRLLQRLLPYFQDIYKSYKGQEGFVTLQGNPSMEKDVDSVINEGLHNMQYGPNAMMKIPVTHAGLQAIRELVKQGVPIMATEVMSLAQTISACDAYNQACVESGKTPPFFLANISGAFDDYIRACAIVENINIKSEILEQAGCIIARRQFRILQERDFKGAFLSGGAKKLYHFTELIGGPMHLTINWNGTADALLSNNPPIKDRLHTEESPEVLNTLLEKVTDFRRAYELDGLDEMSYASFGPVELFRNSFISGWNYLQKMIEEERNR